MNTPFRTLHTSALVLCLLGLGVAAAGAAATTKLQSARGSIKSVDQAHHSLVLTKHKGKSAQAFVWNEQTMFTEAGKTVSAADLKVGDNARVSYETGKGPPLIKRINLKPAHAAKSPQSHALLRRTHK